MGDFITHITEQVFGWKAPICFECGRTMEAVHAILNEGQLEKTGTVRFICTNVTEHRSILLPYVLFEHELGRDIIPEWGWDTL